VKDAATNVACASGPTERNSILRQEAGICRRRVAAVIADAKSELGRALRSLLAAGKLWVN
jgi:hypothetical protein